MPKTVAIAFEGNLGTHYTYGVPEELRARALLGMRVLAPLGHSQRSGYIVAENPTPPAGVKLRDILALPDEKPMVTPPLMRLAHFVSEYYFCDLGQALKCFLPSPVRHGKTETGLIHIVKIKKSLEEIAKLLEKTSDGHWQKKALLRYLIGFKSGEAQGRVLTLQELRERTECGLPAVRALEKQGFLEIALEKHWSLKDNEAAFPDLPPVLTSAQSSAVAAITASLGRYGAFLLHGVTGSGKTEVYLRVIEETLKLGRTAIVLVPEIALTPQTAGRFRGRFGSQVAVLHSAQSDGERLRQWWRIHDGNARVVVGARSAIFSPVDNLGCLIVDEEHEGSYKQNGETPYYNARDLAVMRANLENCPVVLGSATPSMESVNNAKLGKYQLLKLKERVAAKSETKIELVDLNEEVKVAPQFGVISRTLRAALTECLEKKEQAILFLNRRGFVPRLTCPDCLDSLKCPNCSIPLAYHLRENLLKCHLCGYVEEYNPPYKCPDCGALLKPIGYGTQRVENFVQALFPEARLGRMDRDTTSKRGAHERILYAFADREIDILIGTQMIAKGLDFHNVTLVGVLNADISMNAPDFRANERTFQLVTQVVGRAGRGQKAGRSVVQSFTPEANVLQCAVSGDWEGFAKAELELRRELNYPPYSHITEIVFRSKDSEKAYQALQKLRAGILHASKNLSGNFYLTEVEEAYPSFAFGEYRWQIHLRYVNARSTLTTLLEPNRELLKPRGGVKVQIDVDPV